ncbi:MAG: hypothetical protein CME62_07510 [Halobacteriovoraceae bacterium]|nr:hypothetical protein [Halobacteriovoraceae bacterium]
MKKVVIKQVILLHPIKFVCDAFDKFAKDLGVATYSLDQYEPVDYLLNDLQTDALIVHTDILEGFSDQLEKDIKSYQGELKVLVWGKEEDINNVTLAYDHALVEPVDLGQLDNIFSSLLAQVQ